MRHSALFLGIVALTAAAGCAGSGSDDSTGGSAAAVSTTATCTADAPSSVDDLSAMDSCHLQALFEDADVKKATTGSPLLNGPYDGTPICRKDILPLGSQLPAGVKAISGAPALIDFLHLSNTIDNNFASSLWHGKEFTSPPGAKQGTVLNFIDITTPGITATTRKSAEAVHFADAENQWLVLDYTNAVTGLDGLLSGISVEIISHVYDTVRLVNADKQIYLGMAWLVDKPGHYEANNPAVAVPSCYFALQPHKD
jgi:hypothetical protein